MFSGTSLLRWFVIAPRRDRYDPSLELAFALADFFDCAIEDLFNPERE